jgi:hypothetical protein
MSNVFDWDERSSGQCEDSLRKVDEGEKEMHWALDVEAKEGIKELQNLVRIIDITVLGRLEIAVNLGKLFVVEVARHARDGREGRLGKKEVIEGGSCLC